MIVTAVFSVMLSFYFFQYSNVYMATPKLNGLPEDMELQESCIRYVSRPGKLVLLTNKMIKEQLFRLLYRCCIITFYSIKEKAFCLMTNV